LIPRVCFLKEGEIEVAKLVHNILCLPISAICALDNLCALPEFVAIWVKEKVFGPHRG
jgi:hypothetical protein